MAKYSNVVSYSIQTTLDASGIAKLQAEIRNVETELQRMANQNLISDRSLSDASGKLKQLRTLISSAFNSNLGMLDITKFTNGLKSANLSLVDMQKAFSTAGSVGDAAFLNTVGRLGKLDTGIKSVSKTTEKLFNTIGNTVRWGVVASGFQSVLNSAHQTVQYVRDLDTSLTNIMMVTQQSKEQMNEFAQSANEAAKALSSTTVNMTDAALVFAQQGFNTDMSSALAERSTQLANISQQDTPTTSDQITTIMNAYDFTGDLAQIDAAMDSWANVANVSAADVEELATAAQKAASTANTTGVTLDQLNAQIATIESVTREAPENIGNALKTIYSRFADISMGNTLEDGVDLGTIAETLQKVGVNVLNDEGKMNNVGDIMEQLMEVWQSLDQTEQNAISTVIAGRYQLSRFQALMNRSDLYSQYLGASENAEGTADQMQEIYSNSMEGRLNQLQATAEGIFNDIFNTDDFYGMIDALTTVLDLTNQWVNAIGGGGVALQGLGAIATRVFSDNIAQSLSRFTQNRDTARQQEINKQKASSQLEQAGIKDVKAGRNQSTIDFISSGLSNAAHMSTQQQEEFNKAVDTTISLKKQQAEQEQRILQDMILTNAAAEAALGTAEETNLIRAEYNDETGTLDVSQKELDSLSLESNEALKSAEDPTRERMKNASTEASSEVSKFREVLRTFGTEGGASVADVGDAFARLQNPIEKAEQSVGKTTKTGKELAEQYQQVRQAMEALESADGLEEQQKAARILEEELQEIHKELLNIKGAATKGNVVTSEDLYGNRAALEDTDEKVKAQENLNADSTKGYNIQSDISNIVNATGAVGQLAFSWQSFQSLGSIWVNADLDTGQKVIQTIMNLATNIPMLVSAFADLQTFDISKTFDNVANSIQGVDKTNKVATVSTAGLGTAQATVSKTGKLAALSSGTLALRNTALAAASTAAATAVRGLGAAMNFLASGPGIAITLALTAVAGIISAVSADAEQKYNSAKQKAEDAISSYNEISQSVQSFNALYEEYKNTGQVSSEFISSAQELSDTLNIQGGNALIAANNFEVLANKISEVDAVQREAAGRDIEAFLTGSNAASIKGNPFGIINDSAYNDLQVAAGSNMDLVSNIEKAKQKGSISEAIGYVNEEIKNYNDQIDDLEQQIKEKSLAGEDTSNLEMLKDGLLARIDALNNTLSQEDLQDWQDKQAQLAAYNAQDLDLSGLSYQEIVDKFFDSQNGMSEYLESLGNWSDQLSWMIQNTTDETAKLKLQLEQTRENTGDTLYNLAKDTAEGGSLTTYNAEGNITTLSSEQIGEDYKNSVLNRLDEMGFSESQQLNFLVGIDENTSIEQIEQQLEAIKNDPTILSALEFQPTFTNRVDNDDTEISDLLEESDMSENAFNRMSSDMYNDESGYFQGREEELQNALDNIDDSNFKDYVSEAENAEEATEKLREQLGDLGSEAKDTAAYNVRLSKGVRELSDSWEEYGEVLSDDAAKGTADWYDAVGELDEAMSDILNIDVGTLSNEFYKNADAIDAMGRAAEGDMSAIDDLRAIASEDIITHMQITPVGDEDVESMRTELLSLSQQFQADLNAMPLEQRIHSNLDTTDFIIKLNEMLANSQITAEQASNILSSMGVSGTLTTKKGWGKVPVTTYHMEYGPATNVEGMDLGLPSSITMRPETTYENIWTDIPVFEGTHYTGSGVSSVGPVSSGASGGGGGGSKGGGGGGGSGKTYEPKKKDPIEDELDRYERVNTLLDDAENRYERLNADRERLTGFDMADDMEKEVELLNRQIALHREKLEIQKEEAQELRDELSSQYGITFDAEGFITNYATTHDKLVNEVNSLINQYNNTTTEEGQEALEEQIEDAQDALDDFNETYQRYDELWAGDLQETLNTLEDLEDQIEDIRIEMMNTSIEAVDNLQDLQESLNEFNNTFEHFGEDTGLRDAELTVSNLATYFDIASESASALYDTLIKRANDRLNSGLLSDDERQRIQQDIAMWENARKQIGAGSMEAGGTGLFDMAFNNMRIIQEQIRQYEETGTSTIFGENSADLYDAAKEAYDQATGLLSDFEGHYEDLHDAILDMIDETAEKIEKRREQYENITDELDHQREIIELIHGDEAYNELNMIYDAQNQNYLASINEMQQTLDYWKELRDQMEEGSEEWEAINEQIMDTQSELNDLVEESLDNLQEKYENTVNNILDQWTSSAFGGTDLDWVAEEWELINRNADYYLDDVNAAYETQKLQGKYLEMLDQTDDLHIQQMISEQMKQQLNYLREKDKLSEYDVAYANAQLEILQKRIALEEAQRNKSQMQLRRDSQGNYSYVYTADEGDVSAAEGDLLDAQNNAYNLSKEQMQQTQADSLSALQDAQQLLNDIWTNANLTLDEKTERTQTVIDSLKEYLAGTAEQLSESEKNIINDFIGMAEMMTDENGERIEDVLEQVKDGNLEAFDIIDDRWSTALSNWLLNLDDFNISTDDSFSQLIENSVEFQENVDSIASEVNQDFSDMGDTIAGVVDQTKDLASATSDFINQLESDSGIILKYEDQLESMREKIADTTNEMRAYQQQVNQLQSDLTAKEQENANLSAEIDTLRKENESLKNPSGSGGGGGGSSFGGSGYSQSDLAWGIAQNIWTYGWAGGWGNDPTRSSKLTGAYGTSFARQVQDIINQNWSSGNLVNYGSDKFSSYSLIGYDTGGYTGSWSDGNSDAKNGKLAYLHQKELVLNAADTENILKAVDIVRQMVQTLKSSAVADTFSNIANSVSAQSSGETVEQNVHITAEFPAANSAAEIESALLSLNERAIQYSFRKK